MRSPLLTLTLILCSGIGAAAEEAAATREIEHLIAHLGASQCEFNRNGSWHAAERAVAHLRRKYEYLQKRKLVPTAEAFIERAASESSASGKPYLVKCGDAPPVESGTWLRSALAKFRETDFSGSRERSR